MRPNHRWLSLTGLAATALIAAACASTGSTPAASVAAATATPAASSAAVKLGVMTSATMGSFLTGPNGMTLYVFTADKPDVSNCTGQCAAVWPPLTASSGASVLPPTGAMSSFGTLTRADGSIQITYNHMPLYFYAKDTKPGDTLGQGLFGKWFVAPLSGALPSGAPAAVAPATVPPSSGY